MSLEEHFSGDPAGRVVCETLMQRGYSEEAAISMTDQHFDYTAFGRIVDRVELDAMGQESLL